MKIISLFILLITSFLGEALASSEVASDTCDLGKVQTIGKLKTILSKRAVDTVQLATTDSATTDQRLHQLVSPLAEFSSGGGDVGLPMGTGVDGLRALTKHMKAASFRYYGWDYMPTPVKNACGVQEVEVEFIDATARKAFPMTFTFEAGRIVAVAGWQRSVEIGDIDRSGN